MAFSDLTGDRLSARKHQRLSCRQVNVTGELLYAVGKALVGVYSQARVYIPSRQSSLRVRHRDLCNAPASSGSESASVSPFSAESAA